MADRIFGTRIGRIRTLDGFQNFEAAIGLGTDNQMSSGRWGPGYLLTHDRQQLDWMYRTNWVVRRAVSVPADDMTRAGVEFYGTDPNHDVGVLQNTFRRLDTFGQIASTLRWARLYGGALAVIMIEGQKLSDPLRVETVGQGQFKGLLPLDRWQLQPSSERVDVLGPDFSKPLGYAILQGDPTRTAYSWVHHTRVIRMDGEDLPYYQRQYEQGWGMSVVEPFHDRLVAFDSTTLGMAQMVYKAHLRTLKVKGLRAIMASGGDPRAAQIANGFYGQIAQMRRFQTTEGMSVVDLEDEFQTDTYTFGGLSDVMIQMSQQIAGAVEIPLVKFFGMSPAGFSTGDSDLRSYYDDISLKQERRLRHPLEIISHIAYRSTFGAAPPAGFGFKFAPLYGLNAVEKATIAGSVATALSTAESTIPGTLKQSTIVKELRRLGEMTGWFSSLTDQDVDDAVTAEQEDAAHAAAALSDPPGADVVPLSPPASSDGEEVGATTAFKPQIVRTAP